MDVEKTIKVNNLAKELLKHGLVSSIDEGVEKATRHVDRELAGSAELNQEKPAVASQSTASVSPQEEGTDARMFERKLNYMAKSFAEQFNAEIGAVKKQMELMNNDIKSLRQTIRDLSNRSVQPSSQSSSSSQPQQQLRQPSEQQQQPKKKKDDEPIKPRTGDLTPDDIDLEDYFYFGNKR